MNDAGRRRIGQWVLPSSNIITAFLEPSPLQCARIVSIYWSVPRSQASPADTVAFVTRVRPVITMRVQRLLGARARLVGLELV